LREELATTEMYITAFYGVVDPAGGTLRYANSGHPYAFVIPAGGQPERLRAQDPPLGMSEDAPSTTVIPWHTGSDTLLLFTDGVSDARNRRGERLGEDRVLDTVVRRRDGEPRDAVASLFEVVNRHTAGAALRDDLTVVVLKS
jgi:sigma-B regulation protein RsbU (phosphoserine phosphatase)